VLLCYASYDVYAEFSGLLSQLGLPVPGEIFWEARNADFLIGPQTIFKKLYGVLDILRMS